MRSGRRGFVFLVLTLVLAGALRDIPEISSLADDYSNDGVPVSSELLVSGTTARGLSRQERLQIAASRSLALVNVRAHSLLAPFFVLLTAAGQGRLHFLSVQRQ
jgi:hypothetical protein